MGVYRGTFYWGQAADGASETYWTSADEDKQAAERFQKLLDLRVKLMNRFQYVQGVRVAQEDGSRRSQLMVPPGPSRFFSSDTYITVPPTGTIPFGNSTGEMDQFRAVLQQRFTFSNQRNTNRYLSGIPDEISKTEPATYDRNAGLTWWKSLDTWRAYMTSGVWQVRAQVLPPAAINWPVRGFAQSTVNGQLLGVTIDTTLGTPAFQVGSKITLQKFRAPKGERGPTLNGTWYVADTAVPTSGRLTLFLLGSEGITPAQVRFTDKSFVRLVQYGYFGITNIETQRICTHKRGKPSLAPVGRRLIRPSLDP